MLVDILQKYDYFEVTPMEAYSDIFQLGSGLLQQAGETSGQFKTNPLIYMKNHNEKQGHYRIMYEDEFEQNLRMASEYDFAIMNCLTYFGRSNTMDRANKMFALAMDIDGQTDQTLELFIRYAIAMHRFPQPNYIALSGSNIHAYWVYEEPVNLYPATKLQLKEFKYALTRRCWNGDTSTIKKPQFQPLNQGFRPFGCKTKKEGVCVRVFRCDAPKVTIESMNAALASYSPESLVDPQLKYMPAKTSLDDAKRQWPDWYERIVIQGDKPSNWAVNRALYEWFKEQIPEHGEHHHRYFCLMCLSVLGARCSFYDAKKNPNPVTFDEVKRDCYALKPILDDMAPGDPITENDIKSALEGFDVSLSRMKLETVSGMSGVPIQRTKRNGRKQEVHLKIARATQDVIDPDGDWRNKNGAPIKANQVYDWRQANPEGNKSQCARATGLSRSTVIKWWNWTTGAGEIDLSL